MPKIQTSIGKIDTGRIRINATLLSLPREDKLNLCLALEADIHTISGQIDRYGAPDTPGFDYDWLARAETARALRKQSLAALRGSMVEPGPEQGELFAELVQSDETALGNSGVFGYLTAFALVCIERLGDEVLFNQIHQEAIRRVQSGGFA